MLKESKIKLFITLDEKKMPIKIEWEADDAGFSGKKESQTLMLSLWDKKEKMTYSIDLWTKEMTVPDMKVHFHQIFLKMADTFDRATQGSNAAEMIRNFSLEFAKRTGIKDFSK
ncbi:MAG: gliding motility protein GldC [Ignavibacteriaceae bacterium]